MNQFEIQINEYTKKITDLEFDNSTLSQRNKLLEKKLETLSKKYNDLKKELFDIEEHINFCKLNQLHLVNFNEKGNNKNELNQKNFNIFKNKIKTLFEYDDKFMNTDSEIIIFNMIIDDIVNIKNENLNLRKALEDLKNIIENNNNNYNNINNKLNNNLSISNYDNNILPIENSFDNDIKEKNIGKSNFGYTYDITNQEVNDMNFRDYDDINNIGMNSKISINNLMNNIDNLQKVFKTENYEYDIPKVTSNNYSKSLKKPYLYHKYI